MTRSSRSGRRIRVAFFALCAFVWALTLGLAASPRSALAESEPPGALTPRDVPLVLQPSAVKIPTVPASFEKVDRGWLQMSFTPNARERVESLLRDAEDVKAKLSAELGQPVLERVEVRIGRTPEEMAELAPAELPPPAYAEGVAYPGLKLVVLTLTAPKTADAADLDEVFRHELAHIALEDAVAGHHVPTWFNEGVAVYASGEHAWQRMRSLWDARLSGALLDLNDLDRGFPRDGYEVSIAYAESADVIRYLLRHSDRANFASLIARLRTGVPFERALSDSYRTDIRKLNFEWRQEVEKRFGYWPVLTGGSVMWALLFVAMVLAYVKRRRQSKAILARWEREEAAVDAALAKARHVEIAPPLETPDGAVIQASALHSARLGAGDPVAKIEHDGRWHTLH